ncbi:MAG TPA: hypothetical protein VMR06_17460 [Dokdonella sp.]|uniref:hypothetical protein n=1 Tax=Dokdonella sp. TaxID=2291710 RepID=UPI002CE123B3|nr:hypothetical protein [Dokdonella sp.]HUD43775.1 hypothetical protein [Dokdonella sp.]
MIAPSAFFLSESGRIRLDDVQPASSACIEASATASRLGLAQMRHRPLFDAVQRLRERDCGARNGAAACRRTLDKRSLR